MNFHALIAAAHYIATIPTTRFNLQSWASDDPSCGFIGCALGHMAINNIIPGLHLEPTYHNDDGKQHYTLAYHGEFGWQAVWDVFDLQPHDAYWLFDATHYDHDVQPADVAKRITHFVKEQLTRADGGDDDENA